MVQNKGNCIKELKFMNCFEPMFVLNLCLFGKHGYQNWRDYEGSSKTFMRHYYIANMIVLLSKTVSRFESHFLRFLRVAFLCVFSSKCKTII